MPNISVVIPCYNEEESIGGVVQKIKQEVPGVLEIIVVDNNCNDKTKIVAQKAGAKVVEEKTKGYGAAIRRGFLVAKGDVVVVLDGDGQYPAEKIIEMVEKLEKNQLDFISCNRFPLQNKQSLPWVRRFGNLVFNIATNILFRLKLKDSQSGMWIFRKSVLNKIKLESNDMPLSEEIKIKASLNPEIKFAEFPIPYYERTGESKLFPLRHGYINLRYLLSLRHRLWQESGKPVFFSIGLSLIVILFLVMTWQNIHAPFNHVTADVNGQNGMAAENLANYGFFKLKFGVYDHMLLNPDQSTGNFYTHHPEFFVLPTAVLYKLFGVSEVTTRLGTIIIMVLGLVAFAFALRKILHKDLSALIAILILSILPGAVFYGETLELAVYSLPCALISFSFFILYIYENKRAYLYLFFLSLVLGGLMGWFYYLMPVSLWLYSLLSKSDKLKGKKIVLLITTPVVLLGAAVLDLFHFAWLNNITLGEVIAGLRDAFGFRASRQPFVPWFNRIWSMLKLHSTWLFLWIAIIGILVYFVQIFRTQKERRILLVLLLFPVLVAEIFFQWSTHPFGVIYFLPAVAVFAALFLTDLMSKYKILGTITVVMVILIGGVLSLSNLDYFFNKFVIIGPGDIKLLQELKPTVKNDEVCLGQNEYGIGFRGISDWYLQKRTLQAPECNSSTSKYGVIFHPSLGDYFKKEADRFANDGYIPVKCADAWCLLEHKPAAIIQAKQTKK